MNAKVACLVTRRRYHTTPIWLPAYNDGLAAQFGPLEQLHRDKERIHVHMQNGSGFQPERGGFAFGTKMSEPNRHRAINPIQTDAPTTVGLLSMSNGRIGSTARLSWKANKTNKQAETANASSTCGDDHG